MRGPPASSSSLSPISDSIFVNNRHGLTSIELLPIPAMGSSCSRGGGEGSSSRCDNASSSRPAHQVGDISDSSEVLFRENATSVDIEDDVSNFGFESPFTRTNAQSSVSCESSTGESDIADENDGTHIESYDQVPLLHQGERLHAFDSNPAGSQSGNFDDSSALVVSGGRSELAVSHDVDQPRGRTLLTSFLHNVNSRHYVNGLQSLFVEVSASLHSDNGDTVESNSDVVSTEVHDLSAGTEMQDLSTVLHLDLVSISSDSLPSNIREVHNLEFRSTGRRSFWDVLSRQNLRRNSYLPALVFSVDVDDADDLGVHGRLLLDIIGDRPDDRSGQDWIITSSNMNGQRQSRLETIESSLPDSDEEDRHEDLCASGLHQHGTCSCDSEFGADEVRALVRISRIFILIEAFHELLDEIHHHTTSFSASTLSLPAPESVVNSFPQKKHKKLEVSDSSQEQQQSRGKLLHCTETFTQKQPLCYYRGCYICLADYEEDDPIRVLPCKHEYHVACVDKWLKEVHGVCPLCRADVSGRSQSASAAES